MRAVAGFVAVLQDPHSLILEDRLIESGVGDGRIVVAHRNSSVASHMGLQYHMGSRYHDGVMTPYESTGRIAQKSRTRLALVNVTRELLAAGLTPKVEDAAER